jgi:hypothetical protein
VLMDATSVPCSGGQRGDNRSAHGSEAAHAQGRHRK